MIATTAGPLPRVLVIDDELGPRESIRILLKNEYDVICAETVDEGLARIEDFDPDLIILDIRMPGKSGIEGLREIRKRDPNISVVMLTGFGALETAQQTMRLGANDYINKPFDTNEMRQVVKKYTGRTKVERRRQNLLSELQGVNQRLLSDLTSKEQLAAIGQSSSEFAHDLRNPLMIITGYVELLVKQLNDPKGDMGDTNTTASDYLDIIAENVKRCHELSTTWRDYGRSAMNKFCRTQVDDVMKEVVSSVQPLASTRGVQFDYTLQAQETEIDGNRPQLIRAIHNVIANAIQAVPTDTGWVRLQSCAVEDGVEILVKDNGPGMPADVLENIFTPYFTTKGEQDGTGLGLVITQKIIQEHGGTIDVESEEGNGTAVRILIPPAEVAEALA